MKQLLLKALTIPTLLFSVGVFAQAPNWSVNPSNYQYSMTVSAIATKNCTMLADTGNIIAAFQGTICRGIARTSIDVNGKKVAAVIIYSNVLSGETIHFKAYNKNTNEIITFNNSLLFEENATFGYSGSPYQLYTNRPPQNLNISNKQMPESIKKGDIVGILTAIDADTNDNITFGLVNGNGSTHNNLFIVEGNNIKLNADLANNTTTVFNIRVRVSDQHGCSTDSAFVLTKGPQTGITETISETAVLIYPNPASDMITIEYDVKMPSLVNIILYDFAEKKIDILCQSSLQTGRQKFYWDSNRIAAGVYMLRIESNEGIISKKISIF